MAAVKKPSSTQELPNKEAALFRTVVVRCRAAIARGSRAPQRAAACGGCSRAAAQR
jgi:hypothetical protein